MQAKVGDLIPDPFVQYALLSIVKVALGGSAFFAARSVYGRLSVDAVIAKPDADTITFWRLEAQEQLVRGKDDTSCRANTVKKRR